MTKHKRTSIPAGVRIVGIDVPAWATVAIVPSVPSDLDLDDIDYVIVVGSKRTTLATDPVLAAVLARFRTAARAVGIGPGCCTRCGQVLTTQKASVED